MAVTKRTYRSLQGLIVEKSMGTIGREFNVGKKYYIKDLVKFVDLRELRRRSHKETIGGKFNGELNELKLDVNSEQLFDDWQGD